MKSREEIAAAYASEPWWYDVRGFLILTFAYRSSLPSQLRFFADNIRDHHLEVAVGTGTLLDLVLKWRRWKKRPATQIVGVDYAEMMLAGARRRFADDPDVEVWHADVAALPFPDATFDSANIANAVHCFPDVDAAFREIFRVLRSEGRCAANVLLHPRGPRLLRYPARRINAWGMRKGILVCPYDEETIYTKLVAAGFEINEKAILGNTLNVIARKPAGTRSAGSST